MVDPIASALAAQKRHESKTDEYEHDDASP